MKVEMIDFEILGDEDNVGSLIALEQNDNIPFEIKRVYYIFGTKENVKRGLHAHKELVQVAICVKGSCKFILYDGIDEKEIMLNSPQKGLVIREMIWREMKEFSEDCVLLVAASMHYDENDYIRDRQEYINQMKDRL
jgi:dTDP-4-dehydrorhamnose 3,5-epimerase-like enzyme